MEGVPVLRINVRRFDGRDHKQRDAAPDPSRTEAREEADEYRREREGRAVSFESFARESPLLSLRVASPVVEITADADTDGSDAGVRFSSDHQAPKLKLPHTAGGDWRRLRLHHMSRAAPG